MTRLEMTMRERTAQAQALAQEGDFEGGTGAGAVVLDSSCPVSRPFLLSSLLDFLLTIGLSCDLGDVTLYIYILFL